MFVQHSIVYMDPENLGFNPNYKLHSLTIKDVERNIDTLGSDKFQTEIARSLREIMKRNGEHKKHYDFLIGKAKKMEQAATNADPLDPEYGFDPRTYLYGAFFGAKLAIQNRWNNRRGDVTEINMELHRKNLEDTPDELLKPLKDANPDLDRLLNKAADLRDMSADSYGTFLQGVVDGCLPILEAQ